MIQCTNLCGNRLALAGPQRRGRKVGSGKNEKRKAEYSKNVHTTKARKRIAKMNPVQRELERAKTAASCWVSRQIKSWKNSDEFQAIPVHQQEAAEKRKRKDFQAER